MTEICKGGRPRSEQNMSKRDLHPLQNTGNGDMLYRWSAGDRDLRPLQSAIDRDLRPIKNAGDGDLRGRTSKRAWRRPAQVEERGVAELAELGEVFARHSAHRLDHLLRELHRRRHRLRIAAEDVAEVDVEQRACRSEPAESGPACLDPSPPSPSSLPSLPSPPPSPPSPPSKIILMNILYFFHWDPSHTSLPFIRPLPPSLPTSLPPSLPTSLPSLSPLPPLPPR